MLRSSRGAPTRSFAKAIDFISSLREALHKAPDIESLFDAWEQNVATIRLLKAHQARLGLHPEFAHKLVSNLKSRAISLVRSATETAADRSRPRISAATKIDKSVLTIGEPKRYRSREHLRVVARQPCLICGRTPSQAHHVRYAQPRGLGLKVSDEFTVPLCAIHHTENHATGDEKGWWKQHNTDPLAIASSLWREGRLPSTALESARRDEAPDNAKASKSSQTSP